MSSGSESDEEYVPEANPAQLSEEESADDETEKQYEVEHKKRKAAKTNDSKGKKMRRTRNVEETLDEPEQIATDDDRNQEETKKKEDDLWAKFLDGTDTKAKSKEPSKDAPKPEKKEPEKKEPEKKDPEKKEPEKPEVKKKINRIFEFVDENSVVEDIVLKERIKKTVASPATVKPEPKARASTGGLSGLIGQINKKDKLSTLEKSKLDWTTFKKEEGIEEEITSHNKGKQGYLERKDFLERADHRQYEIERELRMKRRSNR